MKVSWKTAYALCCIFFLLLLPFAYAEETVQVKFCEDGSEVVSPEVGDVITLTSELITANSSDYIKFKLQDEGLKLIDNPGGSSINVYGRYINGYWLYETKVEVIKENPVLPIAQVIRDSSQPDLSESEKPESLSIDLNPDQVVSPGEVISSRAILEPEATVNKNYYNFVTWHVSYQGEELELENSQGESLSFTVPENVVGDSIAVSAEIDSEKCGLSQDLISKTVNLKVQDNSLSLQIFPSTDSEGILKGQFIGFSSEILRNGKVAESSISESSEYTWSAKLGDEYINGQRENRTNYAVSPDRTGTLTVFLTVTLKNGLTLQSQTVTKTVVEEDQTLKTINLRKIENGESSVGEEIEVTKEFEPQYVTNLDGATFKWTAVQNEKTIASSEEPDDFKFKANQSGSVSVTLEIKPKDGDPVKSEALVVNILDSSEGSNPQDLESNNTENDSSKSESNLDETDLNKSEESKENINSSEETKDSNVTESEETEEDIVTTPEDSKDENEIIPEKSEDNSSKEPLKVLSGMLQSQKTLVTVGENAVINAKLSTQGNSGDVEYHWKATNKEGNILKESNELENFTFTSKKAGEVDITFSMVIKNKTDSIEEPSYQSIELKDSINFVEGSISSASEVDNGKNSNDSNSSSEDKTELEKKSDSVSNENKVSDTKSDSVISDNNSSIQTDNLENSQTENSKEQEELKKENLVVQETANKNQATIPVTQVEEKNGTGTSSSSRNTSPITISKTSSNNTVPASSLASTSVLNKSSNINNPKTGVDFTIGQIGVLVVCSILILLSVYILFRKVVSFNK